MKHDPIGSRRVTVVVSQQAAEAPPAPDIVLCGAYFDTGADQPIAEALMILFAMKMSHEFADGIPQGVFAEEDQAIEAFFLQRAMESF